MAIIKTTDQRMYILRGNKYKVSRAELKWIVSALNHNIADIKAEMEQADDHSPIYALGEVAVEGRERLVTLLNDIIYNGIKTITIV